MKAQYPAKSGRLEELDSLRGIAALSVVFSHFRLFGLDDGMLRSLPRLRLFLVYLTQPFCAGTEAVILFFILSGLVLSIPAVDSKTQPYKVFIVRRIFRIYFPYLVALGSAILGDAFLHGPITRSAWFNQFWSEKIDWRLVLQHVLFLGQYDTNQFDNPIWSLVHEMRISLIFPFLCAFVLKLRPLQSLISAILFSAVAAVIANLYSLQGLGNPMIYSLHYAFLFVVGIYLARKRDIMPHVYRRLLVRMRIVLVIVSISLYAYGGIVSTALLHHLTKYDMHFLSDWLTALGAAGLIALSLSSQIFQRILLWSPIHNLGKMSYSVYLLHFILLLLFVHLLYGRVPTLLIFALTLAATLLVSWGFYNKVEVPLIALGRRLTRAPGFGLAADVPHSSQTIAE